MTEPSDMSDAAMARAVAEAREAMARDPQGAAQAVRGEFLSAGLVQHLPLPPYRGVEPPDAEASFEAQKRYMRHKLNWREALRRWTGRA